MVRTHGDLDLEDLRIISVAELYSYEDVAFIRRAYAAILGRFPDPGGERYYLARLRAGYSKAHILGQLYHSRENSGAVVSVIGLQSMLRKHRCASWFGLRSLARALGYPEGNSASERQNRALLRELAGIREGIARLGSNGLRLAAPVLSEAPVAHAASPDTPVAQRARQSLTSGGKEFILPLPTDSRTRRLAEALGREVLFAARAA